jgi:hypothetical protein
MSDDSISLSDSEVEVAPPSSPVAKPDETANDNIEVSEIDDEEDDSSSASSPPSPAPIQKVTEKVVEKIVDKLIDNPESSESSDVEYVDAKGHIKSKKQLEREKAFKKTEFAANDPVLLNHRASRRALAERLENDPVFREQYIAEEERLRKEKAEEESSVPDDSDVEDAIKTVRRLQGDDVSSDHDMLLDGISDDGSINSFSFSQSSQDKKKGKSRKSEKSEKSKKSKSNTQRHIGVNIEKLVIKKLVFKF